MGRKHGCEARRLKLGERVVNLGVDLARLDGRVGPLYYGSVYGGRG